MFIKDLETGIVRRYGTNPHDSLVISDDGRTLAYYNLQNGDGSSYGSYVFCDDEGKTPKEIDVHNIYGDNIYFNIGGWKKGEGMKIVIEITGSDIDKIDADSVAEMVFNRLDQEGYDVTVIGAESR